MLFVEKNNRCSLDILHVSHSGCVRVKRVNQNVACRKKQQM